MEDEKNIEKLSRYLIENDEKDYVFLDFSKTYEKDFVISSIKQLVGSYNIISEAKQEEIKKQLNSVKFSISSLDNFIYLRFCLQKKKRFFRSLEINQVFQRIF